MKTISKLLIANRGEIACRVIRTACRLGIKTVAVYSDADVSAQHVAEADESYRLGPAPSKESYLVIDNVIAAAKAAGADAIHPGYGFLSENAEFAAACADNDLIFVGPPADAIRAMGSKSAAKRIMEDAGVPLLPGYHGEDQTQLKTEANKMGYPVLLKAVAGGGGKGMRQVHSSDEFSDALNTAKREAMSSFGDDAMLVEKFLSSPRHVEVQVFFDQHGEGVYLFERDCSVQRRHQKIIEEAPAPGLSDSLRQEMGEAAVRAGAAINYVGAGTVEFLLDVDGTFYFMEMNTRLQVEHPVTEMITGQDLVEWQLKVAVGDSLPAKQEALTIRGHAFEARIYAEDCDDQFLPQTGNLIHYQEPLPSENVRVDSGIRQGDDVSVYYDPMIAKLITWGNDRTQALSRLTHALDEYQIAGVTTNVSFLRNLSSHQAFVASELSTAFIDQHRDTLWLEHAIQPGLVAQIALYLFLSKTGQQASDPWDSRGHWRLNSTPVYSQSLVVGNECFDAKVQVLSNGLAVELNEQTVVLSGELQAGGLRFVCDGTQQAAAVYFDGMHGKWYAPALQVEFEIPPKDFGEDLSPDGSTDFRAPMNGTIVEVPVTAGQEVAAGAVLVVMEAMKMEHAIQAPRAGKVVELFCTPGELVDGGTTLLDFEVSES